MNASSIKYHFYIAVFQVDAFRISRSLNSDPLLITYVSQISQSCNMARIQRAPVNASSASPSTLLHALKAHLLPTPCFSSLPTALTIFANFQLLSNKLQSHAHRVLQLDTQIRNDLLTRGIPETDLENEGTLSYKELKRIRRIARRDEGFMYIFSSEIRKHVNPSTTSLQSNCVLMVNSI